MDNLESIREELRTCKKPEPYQVKEILNRSGLKSPQEKIDLLRDIMGNPEVFYSNKVPRDKNQMLEREIFVFITEEWKVDEMYALPPL